MPLPFPRWLQAAAAAALALLLALAALVAWLNLRGEAPLGPPGDAFSSTPAQVEHGAYLARAGNCAGCHTARGGLPYAGGRGIATPFGVVFSSNLTPDAETGLGLWSAAHFRRAMHHGRSRDGRLLYPAFPYPNYTRITAEDADALFAYLRSLAPVRQARPAHELRFPYNLQAALAVWRALFFRPGRWQPDPAQPADWNRGSYLVRGLGHCNACHAPRNLLGATTESPELSGGLIAGQNWYAPSLASPHEAGVADWRTDEIAALLKHGASPRGTVMGPMAEVVVRSTQHLSDADLQAIAVYLKSLPQEDAPARPRAPAAAPATQAAGARLYDAHCTACHGSEGQGAPGIYPPLAGNRAVTMDSAANLVRIVVGGGFPPATPGNPRPYGMPPFGQVMNDAEVAAVLTYIRTQWGNAAAPVSELQVLRLR